MSISEEGVSDDSNNDQNISEGEGVSDNLDEDDEEEISEDSDEDQIKSEGTENRITINAAEINDLIDQAKNNPPLNLPITTNDNVRNNYLVKIKIFL